MEAVEYIEQINENEQFAYYYDVDGNTIEEAVVEIGGISGDKPALDRARELEAHHFHVFNPNDRNMLTFYKWDSPVYGMISQENYLYRVGEG